MSQHKRPENSKPDDKILSADSPAEIDEETLSGEDSSVETATFHGLESEASNIESYSVLEKSNSSISSEKASVLTEESEDVAPSPVSSVHIEEVSEQASANVDVNISVAIASDDSSTEISETADQLSVSSVLIEEILQHKSTSADGNISEISGSEAGAAKKVAGVLQTQDRILPLSERFRLLRESVDIVGPMAEHMEHMEDMEDKDTESEEYLARNDVLMRSISDEEHLSSEKTSRSDTPMSVTSDKVQVDEESSSSSLDINANIANLQIGDSTEASSSDISVASSPPRRKDINSNIVNPQVADSAEASSSAISVVTSPSKRKLGSPDLSAEEALSASPKKLRLTEVDETREGNKFNKYFSANTFTGILSNEGNLACSDKAEDSVESVSDQGACTGVTETVEVTSKSVLVDVETQTVVEPAEQLAENENAEDESESTATVKRSQEESSDTEDFDAKRRKKD